MDVMPRVVADKPIRLRVLRAGKPLDFEITPRALRGPGFMPAMPAMPPGAEAMMFRLPEMLGGVAGMELANLSPKLGQYFGADKGVLVVRAPAAGDWKLEDGDVITSIDGRVPNGGAHASRILASYQPGEKLELKLLRQRKPLSLDIIMPQVRNETFEHRMRIEHR